MSDSRSTGRTKASGATACLFQRFGLLPFDTFMPSDDQLSDAFAVFHHERLVRQIDQNDFYFSPVIRINGPR